MKKLLALLAVLTLAAAPYACRAAVGTATMTFVMPQSVDPFDLFIAAPGVTYTSIGGVPITGSMILGPDGGLNIHDRIYTGSVPDPIERLLIETDYGGDLTISTDIGTGFSSFKPWSFRTLGGPGAYRINLMPAAGSAPLVGPLPNTNVGGYYGLLFASSNDPAFADAKFAVTGYTNGAPVPTPDSAAVFVVGMAAVLVWLARRRCAARS